MAFHVILLANLVEDVIAFPLDLYKNSKDIMLAHTSVTNQKFGKMKHICTKWDILMLRQHRVSEKRLFKGSSVKVKDICKCHT